MDVSLEMAQPVSVRLYLLLLAAVGVERLVELALSHRNARLVRSRGGLEVGQRHYRVMVVLHSLFLVCCALEVLVLRRPPLGLLSGLALALVGASMTLRYWAISSLGDRWNTRVLVEPGASAVRRGPYRLLRHPNYVAVVAEIAALPLVHGAWLTALVFSLANALLLRVRIGVEETALREHCDYDGVFGLRAGGGE